MEIEAIRRKALATFLKDKRIENGWSQRDLAQRINATQNAVYLWETQKATPDTANLDKIAALFGLKTWELLQSLEENRQVPSLDLDKILNAINLMSSQDIPKVMNVIAQKLAQAA